MGSRHVQDKNKNYKERFHSRGQRLNLWEQTKAFPLHGRRFIVLRHKYGRRDVM